MKKFLKNKLSQVEQILREHHVKKAYLFGSVCTDKFNKKSDIDFLITFNERYFDGYLDNFLSLAEKLSVLLNRDIDLVVEYTLSNPYFIEVLNKTRTPIYEA